MRIPRVYTPHPLQVGVEIELPKETAQHINNVIKRKVGHQVVLFNGEPSNNIYGEYLAEITLSKRNSLKVKVLDFTEKNTLSKKNLELAQCISKSSHFDITLQKSVELGVNIITPIISERSEQVLTNDNLENKMARWQRIVVSAAEQSGRTDLPILNQPIEFQQWVDDNNSKGKTLENTLLLALCTKTNNQLHNLSFNKNADTIKYIIGPEGGLAESEVELLEQHDFNLIKLGTRIMRTETAAIAMTAIIQCLTGEF